MEPLTLPDGRSLLPLYYASDAPFHGWHRHGRWGEIASLYVAAGAPVEGHPDATETPLITAASLGQLDVAKALVAGGADLEARGTAVRDGTALAHAVHFGMPDVVDLLVASGARVSSVVEAAGVGDVSGFLGETDDPRQLAEALQAAAVCDRLAVIDELVGAGVPVDVDIDGATPLHTAAWEGKAAAVRRLLELGADPQRRDADHNGTPLDWCRHRHAEIGEGWGHEDVERVLATWTADAATPPGEPPSP